MLCTLLYCRRSKGGTTYCPYNKEQLVFKLTERGRKKKKVLGRARDLYFSKAVSILLPRISSAKTFLNRPNEWMCLPHAAIYCTKLYSMRIL